MENERMVLRTEHLVKKYGKRTVANDVSIDVHQGEIVGLLGPNGAGKTTTFYMTTGLIAANQGEIYLDYIRDGVIAIVLFAILRFTNNDLLAYCKRKQLEVTCAYIVRTEPECKYNDKEQRHDNGAPNLTNTFPTTEPYMSAQSEGLHC